MASRDSVRSGGPLTPTTHVLAWPGCAWHEITPAIAFLAPHRTIRVLGAGGAPVRVAEGYTLAPDGDWQELSGATEVLLPGGDVQAVWEDATLARLLRDRAASGALVGGVCNGALVLARAGALDGRRCTHTSTPRYAPSPTWDALLAVAGPALSGSVWVDEDVVVDGTIVTAKPWAALRFAKTFARAAGALPIEQAAAKARYLAGVRDLAEADPYERWAVELAQIPGAVTTTEQILGHVRWLDALEADGRLALAGPLPDDAAGLVVLRVATRADAEALVSTDPFVRGGVRRATIRRWRLSCSDNGHLGRIV
ncbi:MAG: DJ-1/PfpI family protein [Pseudomonadota bacterium]|nr:DJ-1/PfpI family protein [Pseudomonadota bacterium]